MSTAQTTFSPRAPRGKPQSPVPAPQNTAGRQSQRKPRGNRANNGYNQYNGAGASPSKLPPTALAESATFASEEARIPSGPRSPKYHAQPQPSIDRVFSPTGAQAPLASSDAIPINPSATPAKIQGAYAGPTFHASPAPSALPIPKFLSRSVPAKTRVGPPTPPPEDSSDSASSSPSPASPSRAPIAVPRNDDSPLDLLFKADKAERAKNVHGSPASVNFFNPARPQHYKHDSYHSLNAVFPIELDGEGRSAHISPPLAAAPAAHRSATEPNKVPQLKDVHQQSSGNDVMQDLFNRLSMSQKKPTSATPPRPDVRALSVSKARDQTPSPFQDGRPLVRSASGPSTPQGQLANSDPSDFFYGNRNLSPLFKAAKGDSPQRNSGLRTEITVESPTVRQGSFQDLPCVPSPSMKDPNTFFRGQPGSGNEGPANARRGSAPFVQPYQQGPNNRRRTPGRQPYQPRQDSYPPRGHTNGLGPSPRQATVVGPPVSAPKPSTSMMSFVPASVAAKHHKASATPSAGAPPPMKTFTPSDTMALEQNLKRFLNLKAAGDTPNVR
ncbi:hypothetical protein EJ02DRAFT_503049 [Clathrospora elynae]|uniref:Proteophosphoglycan 5 n=1 Tax=Clathrospora elynae TaxID=706981 RepID=A0A6A5SPP3_9PLEO|nr:hypothetical protein EJ02DRAFT_503049 [Clathrospora elynae]